jgi:hypothetical protein
MNIKTKPVPKAKWMTSREELEERTCFEQLWALQVRIERLVNWIPALIRFGANYCIWTTFIHLETSEFS